MTSIYYRNSEKIDGRHYSIPKFALKNIDFSDIEARELMIQDGDRLDIIAEQLYNNPDHWKAIAIFNNLEWFFVKPGDVIRVPLDIKKVLDRI
jgi:hypothetical protein